MSVNCKIEISINNISEEKAQAVQKALEPDNINFPNDLSLKVEKIDNKLVFNFQNNGNMKKLISTVDEVLEHVHVSLGVME
jgi:tRNA threonylcarbamoyladenosine modification (KEOPS) complex  Pcc1 subunit|uniref:Transcription factor Pcc1 n=1 Tax=uncultured marine thaumarchaeote KM3_37_D10 TaxID=1456137 RepID=A0A075H0B1_9ARCH|nr:hypothetical protein [uncultured marine thaumarchaeote KM3_37_D10]|tara:strand:+ start:1895 stop:2137 length:243 start_codon:yes stop_codon:yes gene_type:complete